MFVLGLEWPFQPDTVNWQTCHFGAKLVMSLLTMEHGGEQTHELDFLKRLFFIVGHFIYLFFFKFILIVPIFGRIVPYTLRCGVCRIEKPFIFTWQLFSPLESWLIICILCHNFHQIMWIQNVDSALIVFIRTLKMRGLFFTLQVHWQRATLNFLLT